MQSKSILLNLLNTLKPADATVVESLLDEAVTEEDTDRLARLLIAINHGRSSLTDRSTSIIAELLACSNKHVRSEVLSIASSSEDVLLLNSLKECDWDSRRLTAEDDYYELWYGSAAIVAAASAGIFELDEALDRLAMSHYGFAADRLGPTAAAKVADRVAVALYKVLNLGELPELPEIHQDVPRSSSSLPPLTALREETAPNDPRATFQRLAETDEQFRERQRHLHRAYERFSRELTSADARLILTDLTASVMAAIVAARPEFVDGWQASLLEAGEAQKRSLYMFAIQFAAAIANEHADLAVPLLRTYSFVDPLVRNVVGRARLPMEAEVLWSHTEIPQMAYPFLLIHEAQQGCRDATYEPSRFPVAVPYPSPHRATPAYVVVTSSDLDTSRNKASVSGLSWISRYPFASGHTRC